MSCRDADSLWAEFSRDPDPALFLDIRKNKVSPRSPYFRHKRTRELSWTDDHSNPYWVQEKLKDGVFSVTSAADAIHMHHQEEFQDHEALLHFLKSCGKRKDLPEARRIHAKIRQNESLSGDIRINNALVSMYSKCGAIFDAQNVFDRLRLKNVESFNALISGYVQHGYHWEALKCFRRMQHDGFAPNAVTFVSLLKACARTGSLEVGEEIHLEIKRRGLLEKDIILGNTLIDMYGKCGIMGKAQDAFDDLEAHDIVSWNILLTGYVQNGCGYEALHLFKRLQNCSLSPDVVTFVSALKASASVRCLEMGEEIYAEVSKQGLLKNDKILGTAVVDMYAKCGKIEKAQEVFDGLLKRNVVSWNALISGYTQLGLNHEALNRFRQMLQEGFPPDAYTFVCVLKACGSIGAVDIGEDIHAKVSRQGLLEKNIILSNAIIDMYVKCCILEKAREVFDELSKRDVVSWNTLISGYVQHGLENEALSCFMQMQVEGFSPNEITFVCILKACSNIGALELGEEIHAEVEKQRLVEKNNIVKGALVDLYAKCGELVKAQEVFDELPVRDVESWTALMSGYAQLGQAERVLSSLKKMIAEGTMPDLITFLTVINSCSYAGMVDVGEMIFYHMDTIYCLIPTLEHYTCIVDLFTRAGHLDKAINVIPRVPTPDRLPLWLSFLGSCLKWVNVEFARRAFEEILLLDDKCAIAYVCTGNTYAAAGMYQEAKEIEELRVRNEAERMQGRCYLSDASGNVHLFDDDEVLHLKNEHIYAKLKSA